MPSTIEAEIVEDLSLTRAEVTEIVKQLCGGFAEFLNALDFDGLYCLGKVRESDIPPFLKEGPEGVLHLKGVLLISLPDQRKSMPGCLGVDSSGLISDLREAAQFFFFSGHGTPD